MLADDAAEVELLVEGAPRGCAGGRVQFERRTYQFDQLGVVPGLGEEVGGARLDARHRQPDRAPGRHQEHRQRGMAFAHPGQQGQAFFAAGLQREVHILQHQVDRLARQQLKGFSRAGGAQRLETGLLEQQGQRDQHRAVVVDDEDARRVGNLHRAWFFRFLFVVQRFGWRQAAGAPARIHRTKQG